MPDPMNNLANDDSVSVMLEVVARDESQGMAELEKLLGQHPDDPRLHFLKGSLLAGQKSYDAARQEMRKAVDLAPDYAIARFQLGFLLLTSGEAHAAQEAWGPLFGRPEDDPLRLFATGLGHMIRDEFEPAIDLLERGVARNTEVEPLNNDMRLIITELTQKLRGGAGDSSGDDQRGEILSPAQMLLRQAALRNRNDDN